MTKAAMIDRFTKIASKSVELTPLQKRAAIRAKEKAEKLDAERDAYNRDRNMINAYMGKIANAKHRNLEFRLTFDEYRELKTGQICAYTGKRLTNADRTFERINPKEGYVPGNVIVVSADANQHKSTLDQYMHLTAIPDAMKLKLLRKAVYQLEKKMKEMK